jgi:hypothetical protein
MRAWVRGSRDGLAYTGRITRGPFNQWTATPEGAAAVNKAASEILFSMWGKARAARRKLWQEISTAVGDDAVTSALQTETRAYLQRLGGLAYADGLPRANVQMHRLVVIPCVLANGDAYAALERRVGVLGPFAALEGGKPLRDFFFLALIHEMCTAVESAGPSPKNPLAGAGAWVTIGMNATFPWRVPIMNEPPWNGHYYVLELRREGMTRALRKAVAADIARLEDQLPRLSRPERAEILRRARYAA